MSAIEIYGYLAMAVVIASCLAKDMIVLRVGNLIGCVMFIVYGALIGALPVVLMNIVITIIHAYNIYKIKWKSK